MTDSARRSWNDQVIEEFHAGKERIAGQFDRSALLLLGTTGARAGEPRTSPVAYFRDADRYLVVASAAGRDHHPDWYHNLVAHPQVTAEVWTDDGIDRFDATATVAQGAERERLWTDVTTRAPGFAEYQLRTSRVIPVVVLERSTA